MKILIIGWLTFWINYLISSYFLNNNYISRKEIKDLRSNIIKNIIFTLLTIPIISLLPRYDIGIIKYILLFLFHEFWFFHLHYLMHNKHFYKYHSDHHKFIKPNAISGLYCSVTEMILVNQLSIIIPFQMFSFNLIEIILFNILISLNITKSHSGLNNKYLSSNDHENHHLLMNCNYGTFYLFDRIYKTYKN